MDLHGAFPVRGNARAILVVDDDPLVLTGVCKMLASTGESLVLAALSASEALQLWEAHRAQIGLLLSDFVMPETTGDRLALRLLQDEPGLRILFMSGNDPSHLDSEIPLTAGENFLQKPFTVSEIHRSIQNLELAE